MKLFLNKIKLSLQKRTKVTQNKKCYAQWAAKGYVNNPEVSVIIQSHNKSLQILHILPKLRQYPNVEIIVIDDGSDLNHTHALAEKLTGANEFLVRCNDLYENVTYDKTIRFANGKYIALLQDDDDFDGIGWMNQAVAYFKKYPKLAILGGKDGLDIAFEEETRYGHGGPLMQRGDFCFVTAVNRAPMWINKELLESHLHHIDFSFAPFQFDDYEICARAWMEGLQVGWYDARFHSLSVGGMRLWNNAFTKEQSEKNGRKLYDLYHDKIEEIHNLIQESLKTLE
ncbi:glycosyltransferase [uncultured Bacteroides sp.]|uniref:glycosyltransferase n=1 Tax=uncultured Bacteroides sp. TaxID=162156 RepID=UPI00260165CF|nr:glycosyltransferase [uncultured Bacteroides sp.]